MKSRNLVTCLRLVFLALIAAAGTLTLTGCVTKLTDVDKTATAASRPQPTPTAYVANATVVDGIPTDVGKNDNQKLTGGGATFPAILYQRWFADYRSGVARSVEVNYQPVGSGGGVNLIQNQAVDFGASDAPLTDDELGEAPALLQHIPATLGPVVITYNLPNLTAPLRFDGDTLAKVYLGSISKWDDPAIVAANPGVPLPDGEIVVVHRSDGSGTSFVFTDFLSKVSPDWKAQVGTTKNPSWPAGLGGRGNEGVTQQVKQNGNSIGYVELAYAQTNQLPMADVKNPSGEYVAPTVEATSLAAAGVAMPADYRVSIVNSPNKGAYPISSFSYILLYKDQPNAEKGAALVHMLWWAIHDGQRVAPSLYYAPLPEDVVKMIEHTLTTDITSGGQPLLKAAG